MGTHIHSQCDLPGVLFKPYGTLWRCSCGDVWTIRENLWHTFLFKKEWHPVSFTKDNGIPGIGITGAVVSLQNEVYNLKAQVAELQSITEDLYQEIEDEVEDFE